MIGQYLLLIYQVFMHYLKYIFEKQFQLSWCEFYKQNMLLPEGKYSQFI